MCLKTNEKALKLGHNSYEAIRHRTLLFDFKKSKENC